MKILAAGCTLDLTDYLNHIKKDYARFYEASSFQDDADKIEYAKNAIQKFENELVVKPGNKYAKVLIATSVHSFIVIKATKGFAVGDILKAASWKAPATNFARGSIQKGDFSNVRWTGC